ncbi:ribosome assembly RNA-binding protein YhbY [Azonexus sp.]|uniref:ribosome assembly RNA-binding protein YhbY n=1 Tax=Azonexus sp. TaxID=1872668 RepID=UPI0028240591|nr:ribosome assembly RNA-binding protein YhbY [Azonexus sp.]MDR1995185.1 ribosome assembly RNA-binding protein YhbY [Azonexus sp.]
MQQLTSVQVRELRAKAHGLNPVVSISENGLNDAVLKEIDVCLKAHELIKVRVYGDSRDDRLAYLERICQELDAAPVQHIGKLLVVYRPAPADAAAKTPRRGGAKEARRTKRSFQG